MLGRSVHVLPLVSLPSRGLALSHARFMAQNFTMDVYTGDERGAGTSANVHVEVHGSRGIFGPVPLVPVTGSFHRNSKETFCFHSHRDIGKVTNLRIGQDEEGLGAGWYLDRVEVAADGELLVFPCARWLGIADSGGQSGEPVASLSPTTAMSAKVIEHRRAKLAFVGSAFCLPHPDKVTDGERAVARRHAGHAGEDAYTLGKYVIAAADGVFQWRELGIDSGLYSQYLTQAVQEQGSMQRSASPVQLIADAFASVTREKVLGSCTVVTCSLDPQWNVLRTAVLGDSGYLVIRGLFTGSPIVHAHSIQQEHMFGFPYQLGHHDTSDSPYDALTAEVCVQPSDIVVVGTDGLFDNLSNDHIISVLRKHCKARHSSPGCRSAAQSLCFDAFQISQDPIQDTPYSRAATEEFGMVYEGGKKDDITVVVAEVVQDVS